MFSKYFSKVYCFLVRKLKVRKKNSQTISSYPVRFSTDTVQNNNISFLLFFFGLFFLFPLVSFAF